MCPARFPNLMSNQIWQAKSSVDNVYCMQGGDSVCPCFCFLGSAAQCPNHYPLINCSDLFSFHNICQSQVIIIPSIGDGLPPFQTWIFLTNCNSEIYLRVRCQSDQNRTLNSSKNITNTILHFHQKDFSPTESSPPWASPLVSSTNNSSSNANNLLWWLVVWIGSRVYMWK